MYISSSIRDLIVSILRNMSENKFLNIATMKLLKTLFVFLIAVLFGGCIDEDTSDCLPTENFSLKFNYINFGEYINRINIGIFDHNGKCIQVRQLEKSDLNNSQGITLSLDTGKYTAICWANSFDKTRIKGLTVGSLMSDGEISHTNYGTNTPINNNDSLYYGSLDFSVLPGKNITDTLYFKPAHIRLNVYIKGLEILSMKSYATNNPAIRINNLLPLYNFKRQSKGSPISYYPSISDYTSEIIHIKCDVLYFSLNDKITVDVLENTISNKVLWSVDLIKFTRDNGITINDNHQINIPLQITFLDGKITVSLAPWGSNPVDPDI